MKCFYRLQVFSIIVKIVPNLLVIETIIALENSSFNFSQETSASFES